MEEKVRVEYADTNGILYVEVGTRPAVIAEELGNDTLLFFDLDMVQPASVEVLSLREPIDDQMRYDTGADTFVITIAEGKPVERREVAPNLVINFDQNSDPLTVEILNASRVLELEGSLKLKVSL